MINTEYQSHKIFNQLSEYAEFYKILSLSMFRFISWGIKSGNNIDTYTYSSIQGTLDSIKEILTKGRINDAYSLLRKYHDVIIINTYSNLYLKDNFSIDNFIVHKIENWVKGKEKLPEYRIMSQYIRKSQDLKNINTLLYRDDIYKKIRERCNNHTHYNFYHNVLLNDSQLYVGDRLKILDTLSKDIENLFILHFIYMFYINDHYMMSSDYIDHLDLGLTPEEGTQYDVAPFIQNIFNSVIKTNRLDLANELKNNTSMQLK